MDAGIKAIPTYGKKYATLEEAEQDLQVNYFCGGLHDTSLASKANDHGSVNSTPQSNCIKTTLYYLQCLHIHHMPIQLILRHAMEIQLLKVVRLLMAMSSRMRWDLLAIYVLRTWE